ncbi:stalk domain-containing protein [Paenibacillus sp. GCM10027626]|uniref:stalk domain-containing protein n=1 Tax=Paenibacillus sp. GCM10027626 TaxID=3273411 RepID=UPI003637B40B
MLNRLRIVAVACCMLLMLPFGVYGESAAAASSPASKQTTILLDNYPLPFPVEPEFINGTTMVPFRAIAEALRIDVKWDSRTQTITANKMINGQLKKITLRLGDKQATVSGQKVGLLVAPLAKEGTTLIPLQFFSTQFGAKVSWNQQSRTISIQSPVEPIYISAYYAVKAYHEIGLIPHLNSVSFGWSQIDDDGKLTLIWPKPDGDVTGEKIAENSAAGNTTPYLLVFGKDGKGQLTKLLNDPALRAETIDGMIELATTKGFHGIDIDFEGIGLTGDTEQAKQAMTEFMRLLHQQTKPAGLKLSIAVHPPNGAYRGYDYKKLAAYVDEMTIMAYHYEDETSPEPMKRVDEAIRMSLKEVPKEKLVLGISLASENKSSVNDKIGLAKRYGLKGVAFWRIGMFGEGMIEQIERTASRK